MLCTVIGCGVISRNVTRMGHRSSTNASEKDSSLSNGELRLVSENM
jgi:hypothetical protein